MSKRKIRDRRPPHNSIPRFVWPRPGEDVPRLTWSAYLRLIALQIDADYPGAVGQFLASHVIALSLQADGLGATDPASHERLAQEAADAEAAWQQALEHEAMAPGIWSLTDPGDADETGGKGGHLCDDAASRYWVADDPENEVYRN